MEVIQWYQNQVARWNHERTLRRFATHSPFALYQIREAYSKVKSYEKLEEAMDIALKENLLLWEVAERISVTTRRLNDAGLS